MGSTIDCDIGRFESVRICMELREHKRAHLDGLDSVQGGKSLNDRRDRLEDLRLFLRLQEQNREWKVSDGS